VSATLAALLDVADAVRSVAESPEKSVTAMAVTLIGAVGALAGAVQRIHEAKRRKAYEAQWAQPGSPKPLPAPDPERVAMLQRVAALEKEAADARDRWSRADLETRLREITADRDALRSALSHERAMNAELLARVRDLRAESARLREELLAAPLVEVDTVREDIRDRIPTLPPARQ